MGTTASQVVKSPDQETGVPKGDTTQVGEQHVTGSDLSNGCDVKPAGPEQRRVSFKCSSESIPFMKTRASPNVRPIEGTHPNGASSRETHLSSILKEPVTSPDNLAAPDGSTWSQFEIETLNAHNNFRFKHDSPPLTLNRQLCSIAQAHADYLVKHKTFVHSEPIKRMYEGEICGENVAVTEALGTANYNGYTAAHEWYLEGSDYKYEEVDKTQSESFTQLLWRETREFGQAYATRKEGAWTHNVTVAIYFPAGNTQGHFRANVSPIADNNNIAKSITTKADSTTGR